MIDFILVIWLDVEKIGDIMHNSRLHSKLIKIYLLYVVNTVFVTVQTGGTITRAT